MAFGVSKRIGRKVARETGSFLKEKGLLPESLH
jgi:hypothetical protein